MQTWPKRPARRYFQFSERRLISVVVSAQIILHIFHINIKHPIIKKLNHNHKHKHILYDTYLRILTINVKGHGIVV